MGCCAISDRFSCVDSARESIRNSFAEHRDVSNRDEIDALIRDANDTAQFVAQRVVQTVTRDATPNPDVRKADVYVRARPGLVDGEISTVDEARRVAAREHERQLKKEARRRAETEQEK